MHGNVWEWVADCYADYSKAPSDGNKSAEVLGCDRVLRGGSWYDRSWNLTVANRSFNEPEYRDDTRVGFRVARPVD